MNGFQSLNRRSFLKNSLFGSMGFAGGLFAPAASAANSNRPNIIILYSDDQGYGDVGCYGGVDIFTPHIDALAASGTRFTQWYSNAPVCSPSRAALLTGRYPRRGGVPGNVPAGFSAIGLKPDEITLAEALKTVGYHTGISGKWHQGGAQECRPVSQGFDESFGFLNGCVDYYSHIFYWALAGGIPPMHDLWENNEEIWKNGEFIHDLITQRAVQFIRRNKEKPFFLYVPFNAPHYPMHAPDEYFDRVRHIQDPHRRIQAAMVSVLDDSVGKIMDELKRNDLMENTLIFFISDNGPSTEQRNLLDDSREEYHGGSAGDYRGHKFDLFEGGIRVPALMSWPGVIPAGQTVDEIGVTMDVFPTILHIVGADLPTDRTYDGYNILPMVTQNAKSPHQQIFWESGKRRAVRRENWKLILNADDENPILLFDLKADPQETIDLKEKYPALVNALKQEIEIWEQDVNRNNPE